ncbi:hypothetical protein ACFS2C_10270 [Prauserella oleivorans]|uniref:Uncharacterized protein n=1 Tax=Prauserella oleivorans TaxID=1478153 RepID=A0ABW5W960_9PSEU
MAVYDRRAHAALGALGVSLTGTRQVYRRYMEQVEMLRAGARHRGLEWTARDIDVALFWLGSGSELDR